MIEEMLRHIILAPSLLLYLQLLGKAVGRDGRHPDSCVSFILDSPPNTAASV